MLDIIRRNAEGRAQHQAWLAAERERKANSRDHIMQLAHRGIPRYRSPWYQCVYDDKRVPPDSYALERIRKYDPAICFRYNMLKGRWEVWRFRASGLTRIPERPPVRPVDIVHQMEFIGDVEGRNGEYLDVDMRVLLGLYKQDMWRISQDPGVVADEFNRIDAAQAAADDRALTASCVDWEMDNRFQMGRLAGITRMISHAR